MDRGVEEAGIKGRRQIKKQKRAGKETGRSRIKRAEADE
jgi:hypothetical protein